MRDQKWKNMILQGHNLIFLQELNQEFANITWTKNDINPKMKGNQNISSYTKVPFGKTLFTI